MLNEVIDMNPEEVLIYKIFEQAADDYAELRKKKTTIKKDCGCYYSIKDIESFFKSNWCARLLDIIDCKCTGIELLNKVRAQCA